MHFGQRRRRAQVLLPALQDEKLLGHDRDRDEELFRLGVWRDSSRIRADCGRNEGSGARDDPGGTHPVTPDQILSFFICGVVAILGMVFFEWLMRNL